MSASKDPKGHLRVIHAAPIETMIDRVQMRCTICNALRGKCDCWTKCPCGWSFEKGTSCNNPNCTQ